MTFNDLIKKAKGLRDEMSRDLLTDDWIMFYSHKEELQKVHSLIKELEASYQNSTKDFNYIYSDDPVIRCFIRNIEVQIKNIRKWLLDKFPK